MCTIKAYLTNIYHCQLNLVINTHVHADHVTGSGKIKDRYRAEDGTVVQSVISESSGARADIKLKDGQKLNCGQLDLEAVFTPGT